MPKLISKWFGKPVKGGFMSKTNLGKLPPNNAPKKMVLKLHRVAYGKKGMPKEMREYRIDGRGPVGTIKEIKDTFPDEELEIVKDID